MAILNIMFTMEEVRQNSLKSNKVLVVSGRMDC